jgi:hypothetical protein
VSRTPVLATLPIPKGVGIRARAHPAVGVSRTPVLATLRALARGPVTYAHKLSHPRIPAGRDFRRGHSLHNDKVRRAPRWTGQIQVGRGGRLMELRVQPCGMRASGARCPTRVTGSNNTHALAEKKRFLSSCPTRASATPWGAGRRISCKSPRTKLP